MIRVPDTELETKIQQRPLTHVVKIAPPRKVRIKVNCLSGNIVVEEEGNLTVRKSAPFCLVYESPDPNRPEAQMILIGMGYDALIADQLFTKEV